MLKMDVCFVWICQCLNLIQLIFVYPETHKWDKKKFLTSNSVIGLLKVL